MKTDMTVEQLVSKVNDLALIKRDYCVDANNLVVHSDCMGSKLCIGDSSYIMQENAKNNSLHCVISHIPTSIVLEAGTLSLWTSISILLYRI